MKKCDHKGLSQLLVKQCRHPIHTACMYAFLFGSIEPDMNPFTYLRGSFHQQMLRGHNYDNVKASIQKLILKLQMQRRSSVYTCFLLGNLIHYIADSFTYPHNRIFTGTLKEHCQYECDFHAYFEKALQEDVVFGIPDYEKGLFEQIEDYHLQYLKAQRDFMSDSIYILAVTSMVYSYFMEVFDNEQNYVMVHPI